jgi:peptide/nickel transport system permease protein
MLKYVAKRLLYLIPVLIVVPFIVFALLDLSPGDAAVSIAGDQATKEDIQAIREQLHLDDPLLTRFVRWAGDAAQGDLGRSVTTKEPVSKVVNRALPITLSLGILSMLVTIVFGVATGAWAAYRPGGLVDRMMLVLASLAVAVPGFWLGLMLVLLFAVNLQLLPAVGYIAFTTSPLEWLRHLILPAIAMSSLSGAALCLQTRAALVDEMGKDYVLAARAKGVAPLVVMFKHALKNAGVPLATILGFRLGQLLAGSAIIETVFSLHGIGQLLIEASAAKDVPMLLGLVLITTVTIVLANLLVDLSYGYFNPRVRAGAR